MTRAEILAQFHDRCEIVNQAEEMDLLDRDEAQQMRDRYRSEADVLLAEVREEVRA